MDLKLFSRFVISWWINEILHVIVKVGVYLTDIRKITQLTTINSYVHSVVSSRENKTKIILI